MFELYLMLMLRGCFVASLVVWVRLWDLWVVILVLSVDWVVLDYGWMFE